MPKYFRIPFNIAAAEGKFALATVLSMKPAAWGSKVIPVHREPASINIGISPAAKLIAEGWAHAKLPQEKWN